MLLLPAEPPYPRGAHPQLAEGGPHYTSVPPAKKLIKLKLIFSWKPVRNNLTIKGGMFKRRRDSHFARKYFSKSSGPLYISNSLWIHLQTVTKLWNNINYLGNTGPKWNPKIKKKNIAISNFRLFCLTLCILCGWGKNLTRHNLYFSGYEKSIWMTHISFERWQSWVHFKYNTISVRYLGKKLSKTVWDRRRIWYYNSLSIHNLETILWHFEKFQTTI